MIDQQPISGGIAPAATQPLSGPQLQLLVEAFHADLDAVCTREAQLLVDQLRAARRQADLRLGATREELAAVRQALQQTFPAPGAKSRFGAAHCAQIATRVETELSRLFRQVRPETDRGLWGLSPRHQFVPDAVRQLHAGYRQAALGLPDLIAPATDLQATGGEPSSFWDDTRLRVMHLAEELRYAAERGLHLTPRRMAEDLFDTLPAPQEHPLAERYRQAYVSLLAQAADCWRTLRFRLEATSAELRQLADTAASGSSGHLIPRLQHLHERLDQTLIEGEHCLAQVLAPISDFLEGLELDLRLYHRDVVSQLRQILADIDLQEAISPHSVRRSARRVRQLLREGETLLARNRSDLRQAAATGLAQSALCAPRSEAPAGLPLAQPGPRRHAGQVPPAYQQLFCLGPLASREFLVEGDTALEELEEALDRWSAGQACSVALVGPPGSGKRSLLNCFVTEHEQHGAILRLSPPERLTGADELLRYLSAALQLAEPATSLQQLSAGWLSGPRRIVALEGAHLLALRTVGGSAAAQALLQLITATRHHTLWLVTCEEQPWQRLDYLLQIGRCFTQRIAVGCRSATTLRTVIMLRHRMGGLPVSFTGKTADGEAALQHGEAGYFEGLYDLCGGHIEAACRWWLRSLTYHAEEHCLTAQLPPLPPELLTHLSQQQLLSLTEIICHGGLTADEYGRIFRHDPTQAQLILDQLRQCGLLDDNVPAAGRHRVNPLYAETICRALRPLNLLY